MVVLKLTASPDTFTPASAAVPRSPEDIWPDRSGFTVRLAVIAPIGVSMVISQLPTSGCGLVAVAQAASSSATAKPISMFPIRLVIFLPLLIDTVFSGYPHPRVVAEGLLRQPGENAAFSVSGGSFP